jgi:hypothetical protein
MIQPQSLKTLYRRKSQMSSKKCIWDVFLLVNDINDLARGRAAPNPLILKGFWQGAKELNPVSQGWSLLCCRNTYPLFKNKIRYAAQYNSFGNYAVA